MQLFCPDCGYDLRARTGARCPECGLSLEFINSERSAIPWAASRGVGAVWGYVATAFDVLLRLKRICREVYRPVDYFVARRFQAVTVAWTGLSTLAALAFWLTLPLGNLFGPPSNAALAQIFAAPPGGFPAAEAVMESIGSVLLDTLGTAGTTTLLAGSAIGIILALTFVTGVPSYLFHPRKLEITRQNRALALSYYACAPLAFVPPMFLLFAWLVPADARPEDQSGMLLRAYAVAWLLPLLLCAVVLVRMARRLVGGGAALRVGLAVPVLWLLVAAFGLAVPLLVGGFAWLLIDSLRF